MLTTIIHIEIKIWQSKNISVPKYCVVSAILPSSSTQSIESENRQHFHQLSRSKAHSKNSIGTGARRNGVSDLLGNAPGVMELPLVYNTFPLSGVLRTAVVARFRHSAKEDHNQYIQNRFYPSEVAVINAPAIPQTKSVVTDLQVTLFNG